MTEQTNTQTPEVDVDAQKKALEEVVILVSNSKEIVKSVETFLGNVTDIKPLLEYFNSVTAESLINDQTVGLAVALTKGFAELSFSLDKIKADGTDSQRAYHIACFIYRLRAISLVAQKNVIEIDPNNTLHQAMLELAGSYFTLYFALDPNTDQKNNPAAIAASPILSAFSRLWETQFPQYSIKEAFKEEEENTSTQS